MSLQQSVARELNDIRQAIRANYLADEHEVIHRLIAEATQNSVLVDMVDELWRKRDQSPMWAKLHDRIFDAGYRQNWLDDHQQILTALRTKDRDGARAAMWQHLAHVRETLMELSDVDDPAFDGYLFQSISAPT